MLRFLYLIVAATYFIGCGTENAHIADKVKYRIFFKEQSTLVSFELAEAYKIKSNGKYKFDTWGQVFTKWNEETSISELGARAVAVPEVIRVPRGELIDNLPGNRSLPSPVTGDKVYLVTQQQEDFDIHITYLDEKHLVVGGGFSHPQFQKIPKNFFATQKFYSSNGDTEATISILGPSKNFDGKKFDGGIFFFGNFGINPFSESHISSLVKDRTSNLWETKELSAESPLKIHSYGQIDRDLMSNFKVADFMNELNDEFQKIESVGFDE